MGVLKMLMNTTSTLLSRARLSSQLGLAFGTARDYYKELGYSRSITYQQYYGIFRRQDIAKRIVKAAPEATWEQAPMITDDPDPNNITRFEKSVNRLVEKSQLYHYLERADILSGIGNFGTLLMGVNDGKSLDSPMGKVKKSQPILYFTSLAQDHSEILTMEDNTQSERFNLPLIYKLDLSADVNLQKATVLRSVEVHHSRVLHVAEGLLEDDLFGTPRLEAPFNLLADMQKVVGGSAEMFWQGAFRGFQMDIDKDMVLDTDDEKALSDEIDEYMHGLRRFMRTRGVEINSLAPNITDPRGTFSVIMALMSGTTGIPQRVLMGSERGQLASEQDERNWNRVVLKRRKSYAEPKILRPVIDTLIEHGGLPKPRGGEYVITWPDIAALSDEEKANVAMKSGTAAKAFTESGSIISPAEVRQKFFDLPPENDDLLPPPKEKDDGNNKPKPTPQ